MKILAPAKFSKTNTGNLPGFGENLYRNLGGRRELYMKNHLQPVKRHRIKHYFRLKKKI